MEYANMQPYVRLREYPYLIVTERDLAAINTRVVTLDAFAPTQQLGWTGTRGTTQAVRTIVAAVYSRYERIGHFHPTHPLGNESHVQTSLLG